MLRCITKNILADVYFLNREDNRYEFIKDMSIFTKNSRINKLLEEIKGYDLIFLQEVELKDKDLILSQLDDYCSFSHEITKSRTNIIGNVTLWRKNIKLINKISNSTTVFILIEFHNNIFAIGNTHLTTHKSDKDFLQRYYQLKSSIKILSNFNADKTILVGDFNDELINDTITEKIVTESLYNISKTKETCHIWKDKYQISIYLSIDKILFKGLNVEIGYIPENRPIPDENEISDHFAIPFDIYY
jgi:endonuclease/exonuclease/phosphatase family metal-dependent hydrolase